MRLTKKMQDAINDQINMEFLSAYSYLAMAAWCERMSFRGSAAWLRAQSIEERGHAMRLFEFLVDRGAVIELKAIPGQQTEWPSLHGVFEQALKNEELVSESINRLYELSINEKAFATAAELQWFLTEQVEEEKTARDIVAKFHLIGNDPSAMLDLDRELASRTAGGAKGGH
ncbi:MAG: ferritin [Candidatus Sumerlaeaceae bacterium]